MEQNLSTQCLFLGKTTSVLMANEEWRLFRSLRVGDRLADNSVIINLVSLGTMDDVYGPGLIYFRKEESTNTVESDGLDYIEDSEEYGGEW